MRRTGEWPVRLILTIALLMGISGQVFADDFGPPDVEDVYGGRVLWLDGYQPVSHASRIFASTESANSIFFMNISYSGSVPALSSWQAVPDFDANAGFGSNISQFAVDEGSGYIFVIHNSTLYSCSTTAGSRTQIVPGGVNAVEAYNGYLFYTATEGSDLQMHFGTISGGGAFVEHAASPVTVVSGFAPGGLSRIIVNPANSAVYLLIEGNPPLIYKSSAAYSAFGSGATFATIGVASLGSTYSFKAFGIGPDGRIFAGASANIEPSHYKVIAYTDGDADAWTIINTGIGGTSGTNIAVGVDSGTNYVYFGSAVSIDNGVSGSWHAIPNGGTFDTHPNDGPSYVDPSSGNVAYITTDLGAGYSPDNGTNLIDFVDGMEAVQINDFDMDAAKVNAWSASKSGVRRVADYGAPTEKWSVFFPYDDGSPYFSVAMDKSDLTGNTAYAGNVRLYKTTDGGTSWNRIFSTEDYSSLSFWSYVAAITVSPTNPDVVVIGVNSPNTSGIKGAIFYSTNATSPGPVWTQLDTEVYNTEVLSLLWVDTGSGNALIYVGCEYVNDGTASSYGVKTITYSGGSFSYNNDMIGSGSGTVITNFGCNDLAIATTGTIYASGINSAGEPRVYSLAALATTWDLLDYASLPANGSASAITVGKHPVSLTETPYLAVVSESLSDIFYLDGSTWVLAYNYPVGTDINVLYWDDLLVGTGTGLYGHNFNLATMSADKGTVGTELTLTGSGFGSKTPIVIIGDKPAKVLTSSDTSLTCLVTMAQPAGEYDVIIYPRESEAIQVQGKFTYMAPEISGVTPNSAKANAKVQVQGAFFGKKAQIFLVGAKGKKTPCEVKDISMNPTDGTSTATIKVPNVPAKTYSVIVANKVGWGELPNALTIVR